MPPDRGRTAAAYARAAAGAARRLASAPELVPVSCACALAYSLVPRAAAVGFSGSSQWAAGAVQVAILSFYYGRIGRACGAGRGAPATWVRLSFRLAAAALALALVDRTAGVLLPFDGRAGRFRVAIVDNLLFLSANSYVEHAAAGGSVASFVRFLKRRGVTWTVQHVVTGAAVAVAAGAGVPGALAVAAGGDLLFPTGRLFGPMAGVVGPALFRALPDAIAGVVVLAIGGACHSYLYLFRRALYDELS